tara:strand:+ start:287 stop:2284 length:1998 start_codon:yes stop_codon:yes gene_type:complete
MPKSLADVRTKRIAREIRRTGEDPVAHVDSQFTLAEEARSSLAREWLLNKTFIRGDQWYSADDSRGNLRPVMRRAWRKQVTVNGLFSIERVIVSKLTAQRPEPSVLPATNTDEDRDIARACERLIKYHFRKMGYDLELTRWVSDLFSTGSAWWKVTWDPDGGETIVVDPVVADELNLSEKERRRKEGDLSVESVSPFEIFVDPGAKRMRDVRWIVHVHLMHIDEVYERWGEEVVPDSPSAFGFSWIDALDTQLELAENMVMVKEYWERPSKDFPGGRRILCAGGTVLEYEKPDEDEDPIDKLPFVYCTFYPDTESFYGITPMRFARELQMNVNQLYSLIVEQVTLAAHGKWLIPKGSGVTKITSAPGEKIEYNPTHGPPQWIRGDPVSPNMMNLTQMFREAQQYVLGLHEASLGMAGSSQSGRSVLFQSEQDNTKLGPTLKCIRQALRELGRMMLETWRDNADYELNYRIMGENAISEVLALDAGQIRFSDVEFQIESSLPSNREARRQLVLQLAQMGLIDRERALRMLEFGDIADILGGEDRDRERARHENDMLFGGQMVNAAQYEDHAAHLETHIDTMKEQRFYTAPQEIKSAFLLHIQQHAAMLQGGVPPMAGQAGPPGGQGEGPPTSTPDVPAYEEPIVAETEPPLPTEQLAMAQISGASI